MALPAHKETFDPALERVVPNNIEAEQALLGAILVNNEAFYRVSDFLEADHFYEPLHRTIYETLARIVRAGKSATPITIKTFLPADERIGEITVAQYLARLAGEATTIINALDYGHVIRDAALRRQLIGIGEDMVNTAFAAPVDHTPREQIEETERRLYELAESGRSESGFIGFSDAIAVAVDMAAKAYQRDSHLSGLATGLYDLDRLLGGLQASDLVIIAARPAMGKTALATNIAFHAARNYRFEVLADGTHRTVDGGVVAFFSLEMSCEQLATRLISEQTRISSADVRRGRIDAGQFERLVDVSREIQDIPLFIDDTGGISIAQLAARARRVKRQRGMDLMIVDYLQLLQGSRRRADQGRVQEITEITTSLKALAKELDVPIIALSQLSRQVESREDKRPQLADLRESGSIEQDADVVMFIYREEYYKKNAKPKEGTDAFFTWQAEMEEIMGRAEVIIGKQRHGPTGTVELHFDDTFTRFSNLAKPERIPDVMD